MRFLPSFFAIALTASSAIAQTPTASPIPVSPETRTAVTKLIGDIIVNGKAYSKSQRARQLQLPQSCRLRPLIN
jgi:hypothetical protein